MMNDYDLIRSTFSEEQIKSYNAIRTFQQNIGNRLEDYINTKLTPDMDFVGRNSRRTEGVDYVVRGEYWSVKNAWNTENNSQKRFREDRNIRHWYRLNRNGSTNWETLFVRGCSEREFIEFITGTKPSGLEEFM